MFQLLYRISLHLLVDYNVNIGTVIMFIKSAIRKTENVAITISNKIGCAKVTHACKIGDGNAQIDKEGWYTNLSPDQW